MVDAVVRKCGILKSLAQQAAFLAVAIARSVS